LFGHGGCESVADGGECGAAGEAGGDNGAEVGVRRWRPFQRNPFVALRKNEGRRARSLLLLVASTVAARQEHQQLVARRHRDGGTQVATLDIGRLEIQQTI